jgi:hypothetical protein
MLKMDILLLTILFKLFLLSGQNMTCFCIKKHLLPQQNFINLTLLF